MSEQDATLDEFVDENKEQESIEKTKQVWLGPRKITIPSHWNVAKLEDVGEIVTGDTPSTDNEEYFGKAYPFVTPEDLGENEEVDFIRRGLSEQGLKETRPIPAGSVMMDCIGSDMGKVALAKRKLATNQQINSVVPDETVANTVYIKYQLQSISDIVRAQAGSTTTPILNKSRFSKSQILLATLEEQLKIASVLYNVDQAIQKTEEIKLQTRRTQQGLIQDLLTTGLDDANVSDTGTKLGEQPEHWEVAAVEDIVADEENAFTDGARYALSSDEIHKEGEARAILLQEVGEGEFNDLDPKFATQEKYDEITHRAIYPGEVVVAKMAEPVARACLVPDSYDKYLLGCADVVRVLTNDEFDDRFLMYCMNSHKLWKQAVAHLRGTGRSRINLENIAELLVPKPPLSEQKKIADALEQFDKRIENERNYHDRLQRLKQGLMQDLLSGTVRTTGTNIEVLPEVEQHG